MVEVPDVAVRNHLRIVLQLLNALHLCVDEPVLPEYRVPLRISLLGECILEKRQQFRHDLRPVLHALELRLVQNMRKAQRLHERTPVPLRLWIGYSQPAPVLALVDVVHVVAHVLAVQGGHVATDEQIHSDRKPLKPHRAAHVRHFYFLPDALALPRPQGRKYP